MKMKKILFAAFLFLCSLSLAAVEWHDGVNVKDFGAVGDGVTDDTAALQKALRYCQKLYERQLLAKQPMADDLPEFADHKAVSMTGETVRLPEIFFPAGRYIISNTLVAGDMVLRGEEGSEIVMTDPAKDILYCDRGYRSMVSGLTFEGGKRQILNYTFNEDMTYIAVENCTFRNSSSYALWSHNYRNPSGYDYFTITKGPYSVEWVDDMPVLTPGDETLNYYANSTLLTVYNCRFENCAGVADMATDGLEVRNCSFIMPEDFTGIAVKTGSECRYVNCYGYAPKGGSDKYWFDVGNGRCLVADSVFECGSADGITLARISYSGRGEAYDSCMLLNNTVACGNNPMLLIDNSKLENTPNIVEISGCREINGSGATLVEWVQPFDFERAKEKFFDFNWVIENLDGSYSADFPFLFTLVDNEGFDDSAVPAEFWQASSEAVPAEVMSAVNVEPVALEWDERGVVCELKAVDFGVDLVSATDDTEAMQKLFAAAREIDGKVKIIMPPALVTVSESISIPADSMITVTGLGSVKQLDIKKAIFTGDNVNGLAVRNMRFVSGSNAFVLNCTADARIIVEKCLIYQQYKSAFDFTAPAENNSELLVDRCMFVSPIQGVVTNFAHSELRNFWVSTNGRQNYEAFIENRGGDMLLYGMLGVPMTIKDHGYNHLAIVENWPFSNETRWIDNYGRLDSFCSRFGGEYYGITPIHNFTDTGTVAVTGAFFCAAFPDCTNCIVYCEKTPAVMLFRDFGWHWKRGVLLAVKYAHPEQQKADVWCQNFYFSKEGFNVK